MNEELMMKMVKNELGNRTVGETFIDGILNIVPDVIVLNTRPIKDLIRGTYNPNTEEKIFHAYYDNELNPFRPSVLQVVEIVNDKDRYYRLINRR